MKPPKNNKQKSIKFFAVPFNFVRCELIADIVIMVIRMPLHFDKAHLMLLGLVDQRDPEIFIFNRLFLRIDPAVSLPGQSPAVMKSVADISAQSPMITAVSSMRLFVDSAA